ncbi:hypothetical protein PR048_007325 [Dryococelus australis]|uniref:Uncharacterized protein n=1 Tax=Dryococelus australis TaxID=614101 RepID=A0ABQ9IDG4_9NEOP|nr:hypothetical protein PR048_007325 [Dryococelus australis]
MASSELSTLINYLLVGPSRLNNLTGPISGRFAAPRINTATILSKGEERVRSDKLDTQHTELCACSCIVITAQCLYNYSAVLFPLHKTAQGSRCDAATAIMLSARVHGSVKKQWIFINKRYCAKNWWDEHYKLHDSPPTQGNRVRLPDIRMWESCRTMPLVSGFSRNLPSLVLAFLRCSALTSLHPPRLGEIWAALNIEVSVEQHRNARAEETGDPRENPPDSSIAQKRFPHAKICERPAGNRTCFTQFVDVTPFNEVGPRLTQWLESSLCTKANRIRVPKESLRDFLASESCRTMPLVGGFSRGSPISPTPVFECFSIFTSLHPQNPPSGTVLRRKTLFYFNNRRGCLKPVLCLRYHLQELQPTTLSSYVFTYRCPYRRLRNCRRLETPLLDIRLSIMSFQHTIGQIHFWKRFRQDFLGVQTSIDGNIIQILQKVDPRGIVMNTSNTKEFGAPIFCEPFLEYAFLFGYAHQVANLGFKLVWALLFISVYTVRSRESSFMTSGFMHVAE